jgi:hypothetical protein
VIWSWLTPSTTFQEKNSPGSLKSPSPFQSNQAPSRAPEGAFATVTSIVWVEPAVQLPLTTTVTPSSSAPSPVASAVGWPSGSISTVEPMYGPLTLMWWRAPLLAVSVP